MAFASFRVEGVFLVAVRLGGVRATGLKAPGSAMQGFGLCFQVELEASELHVKNVLGRLQSVGRSRGHIIQRMQNGTTL